MSSVNTYLDPEGKSAVVNRVVRCYTDALLFSRRAGLRLRRLTGWLCGCTTIQSLLHTKKSDSHARNYLASLYEIGPDLSKNTFGPKLLAGRYLKITTDWVGVIGHLKFEGEPDST